MRRNWPGRAQSRRSRRAAAAPAHPRHRPGQPGPWWPPSRESERQAGELSALNSGRGVASTRRKLTAGPGSGGPGNKRRARRMPPTCEPSECWSSAGLSSCKPWSCPSRRPVRARCGSGCTRRRSTRPTPASVRAAAPGRAITTPPWVPGADAAGVIDQVGEGAPWQVGDEVIAITVPASVSRGIRRPGRRPRDAGRPAAGRDRHGRRLDPPDERADRPAEPRRDEPAARTDASP